MKKTFKGNPTQVMDELEDHFSKMNDTELQKTYQVTVDDNRSLALNKYYQVFMRIAAEQSGEEDFEYFKMTIKDALGEYSDDITVRNGRKITDRYYNSTADMSNAQLVTYIQKVEAFLFNTFGYDFAKLKKQHNVKI